MEAGGAEMRGRQAIPMISYEDVASAIDWLTRAFGFREIGERYHDDNGRVTHAELELDGAVVYLGWPGPEYVSPKKHAELCDVAGTMAALPYVIDGVHLTVGDVDAHCERAKAAGAIILREPASESYGRVYNAADPEGHRWMFMQ